MSARAVVCCLLLGLAACFRVDIDDGKLKCSTGGGCPRGYACDVDDVCRRPDALLDLGAGGDDLARRDASGINGDECTTDDQCNTRHCADGVCCTTACSGPCATCNASADFRGQCLPLPAGSTPIHPGCTAVDVSSCGNTGLCGEEGACQLYAASTICATGTCTDNETTPDSNCNGTGACVRGTTPPVMCTSGCGGDLGDCASTPTQLYCNPDRDACLPTKPLGAACGSSADCTSNFCVDGFCCNVDAADCSGCKTCSLAGSEGTCVNVPANAKGPTTMCAAAGCSAATCDGLGNCAAAPEGTACGSTPPACANGPDTGGQYASTTFAQSVCDGQGIKLNDCQTVTSACGNAACASSNQCVAPCMTDADCDKGYWCVPKSGACTATLSDGNTCNRGSQCQSAVCDVNGSSTCVDCVNDADCTPQTPYCDPGAHTCGPCVMAISGDAFGKCAPGGSEMCNPLAQSANGGTPCPSVRAPNCYGTSAMRNLVGTCGCAPGVVCPNGTACVAGSTGYSCLAATGFPCLDNGDCASAICADGACAAAVSGMGGQN